MINHNEGDFPGSAVVKTLPSNEVGEGSISGQGTRSHLLQDMAKIKINKLKKTFKNHNEKQYKNIYVCVCIYICS